MSIDIVPTGAGCRLTLTHEGVPEEYREQTEGDRPTILRGAEKVLGEQAPSLPGEGVVACKP